MLSILNTVCLYRISVYRTHADIGLSKRSKNNPTEKERFNITKAGGPRMTGKKTITDQGPSSWNVTLYNNRQTV